ncbi:MAG: hypothetical protein DDT19_02703 [Syntrophomonadaceae bacterium]|nr:hypothetical protein [Bacillota bacterium]
MIGADSLNTAFAGNISGATGTGLVVTNANNVGIGLTPTATLHLRAGTAAANTAPLKFTSGPLNTTPEPGAIEFLTDAFHGTITTGGARRTFAFLESPTFTGTVTIPTPFTLGAVSVAATGTELNHVVGVTSAIQTQINARAPIASPTFTGDVTMPGTGRWNSLGNVGVGTLTPATRFHVAGTTRGEGGAQILALSTPGTPTVTPQGVTGTTVWGYRVTARSVVGETLASVEGRATTGNAILSATNFNRITWSAVSGAVDYRIYRTTAGGTPSTTGLIGTTTSLTFDDTGLAASRAVPTMDSSGNVGIGTTNPQYPLHVVDENAVYAAFFSKGDGNVALRTDNNNNNTNPIFGSAPSFQLTNTNSTINAYSAMRFTTGLGTQGVQIGAQFTAVNTADFFVAVQNPGGNSQALTVKSIGSVGIGTTSPAARLHVMGADSLNTSFAGNISGATGTGLIITNANNVGVGVTAPTHQLQLSTDSAGKPATNTWTIVSDKRLKKSIEPANLDLCYNAVKTIPLSFYRWRDDVYSVEQVRDRGQLGWIADDVEKVYPKAVKTVPFELLTKEKIEDCKSVNNDQVYAALYGAVQRLIEKVEALERRIK